MHSSNNLNLSRFSQDPDDDLFFEDDDIQDVEFDRELNQLLGRTELDEDETDNYFWNEN